MNLQIGDTAVLGARTHNGSVPKDLLEVIARTTACSPMVFAGLLAWASLDRRAAHSFEGEIAGEITTAAGIATRRLSYRDEQRSSPWARRFSSLPLMSQI